MSSQKTPSPQAADYPILRAWLVEIKAECRMRIPSGPIALELWHVTGSVFFILVRAYGGGWAIFTSLAQPIAAVALADAETRLKLT